MMHIVDYSYNPEEQKANFDFKGSTLEISISPVNDDITARLRTNGNLTTAQWHPSENQGFYCGPDDIGDYILNAQRYVRKMSNRFSPDMFRRQEFLPFIQFMDTVSDLAHRLSENKLPERY